YALAQSRAGDGEVFYVHIAYERLDYRKRRGKNICTLCRKSLYLLLFVEVENLYHIVQRDKVCCKHIIVVHGIERVLVHHLVDFEQVPERASDAYHLRVGVYVREPLYAFELFGEELFYAVCRFFWLLPLPREHIRERYRAERKRCIVEHIAPVVVNDFGGTAADF